MSIRARLTLVSLVVAMVAVLCGATVVYAVTALSETYKAETAYSQVRRQVSVMRDAIFDYLIAQSPQAAARVFDESVHAGDTLTQVTSGLDDPRAAADAERLRSTLSEIGQTARELESSGNEPAGAVSRRELVRRLAAYATESAAGVDALETRAAVRTAESLSWVRNAAIAVGLLAALLVVVLLVTTSTRIVRGLRELDRGFSAFGAGRFDTRISIRGDDELTRAAEAFDAMAVAVQKRDAELVALNERLVESDRAKSMFIANMNHDLRTPLNSIIGFSGVLLSEVPGPLNEEQSRQLDFISRSGNYLKGMVEDMLEMSMLDSAGWHRAPRRFELDGLVRDTIDSFLAQADAKGVELTGSAEPTGVEVIADEIGTKRILGNLVGNALKFTEAGSVTVSVTVRDTTLVLTVSDTGPGIAAGDRDRVFEPFEQATPIRAEEAKHEGAGLGLAIVRRIVAGLDGTMEMDSEPGTGTTFIVTLPVERV